jgi:hypothetical protein
MRERYQNLLDKHLSSRYGIFTWYWQHLWSSSGAVAGGLWGFVVGLLGSSLLSALFFGVVLVLLEINENMKGALELLEQRLLASDGESAESFEDDDQEVGTFLPSDLS